MAAAVDRFSSTGNRRQPSRLQRRAPASIQINRASEWNVAIPLLSPLATSPVDRTMELKPRQDSKQEQQQRQTAEQEKPPVFKKWQHPAAPFCHDQAPFVPYFVL